MGLILGEVALWVADVTVLSAILAVVEIVMERDRGWASTFDERGLGRKLFAGNLLVRWIDKPYVTAYHLLVFGGLLPGVLWTQYSIGVLSGFHGAPAGSHSLAAFVYFLSAYLTICIFEDFLWFALNWYYPRSLTDLLAGRIWWHTDWVGVGAGVKVPRCYLSVGGIGLCLLVVSFALPR
ncbi:MAG TPA: hypothetical protein VME68_03605 [Acidobacteriaceae bacterium]|nr:hypothetical protein [Acidobacteriaceae bacterium]